MAENKNLENDTAVSLEPDLVLDNWIKNRRYKDMCRSSLSPKKKTQMNPTDIKQVDRQTEINRRYPIRNGENRLQKSGFR